MTSDFHITTREAAAAYGVSPRTIRRWAQNGRLDAAKVGGRWQIAVPVDLDGFKPFQVEKATELLYQGGVVPTSRPDVYRAVNPDGTVTYLVNPAARTCTCKAGERGIRCYHLAAALMVSAARRAA